MVFPAAYGTTVLVEVPVVVALCALLRIAAWQRSLTAALAVNLLTVPLLWFVVFPPAAAVLGWLGAVLLGEVLVVVVEAVAYARALPCPALAAAGVTLVANGLSVLTGLALGG